MKQIQGIWFPEDDTHFEDVINSDGTYQRDTFDYAMSYVKTPKIFYDIGAHVGLWSLQALKSGFQKIEAFEPNPKTFECLKANIKNPNVTLHKYGISDKNHSMSILEEAEGNSGAIKLVDNDFTDKVTVNLRAINTHHIHEMIYAYNLKPHETLVKIDTEGMEAECILGMDKVLYALRPVMCVEQKSNKDALDILQKMGMEIVNKVRKDYILTWKNQ